MNGRIFMPLALALSLTACGGEANPENVIASVRATELAQLESIAAKDLRGIERLYGEDARLVRPDGSVLNGQAAIAAEYEQLLADPQFSLTIEPQDAWASADEEMAVITSYVTFVTSDPETGEPVTTPLDSQTVWQKTKLQTWYIVSAYNVARAEDAPQADESEAETVPTLP